MLSPTSWETVERVLAHAQVKSTALVSPFDFRLFAKRETHGTHGTHVTHDKHGGPIDANLAAPR
jgi:hypothetical protein